MRFVWYFLLFISYFYALALCASGLWLSLPLLSLVHWLLSTDLLHNGTHYQIFASPKWNLVFASFGCYHAPALEWELQHVLSHHSYTNILGLDVDLNHFLDNFRTSKLQSYVAIYRKWRYFMPIYFAAASIGQIDSWTGKPARHIHRDVPFWRTRFSDPSFRAHCAQICWTMFIVPTFFFFNFGVANAWKAFIFLIVPRIGHGMLFYLFFAGVSHSEQRLLHRR